jgi:hypothetical protein
LHLENRFDVLDVEGLNEGNTAMDATGIVLQDGDIIEFEHNGEKVTAMVLLVTPEAVIFDLNDGSMPRVAHHEDLPSYRIFDGAVA